MTAIEALGWTARILGLLSIVQGIEFLLLARATSNVGVWRWKDLEPELSPLFRPLLGEKPFNVLNVLRTLLGVSCVIAPNAASLALLFIIHVLTLLRWLGSFNGGSDYMTLLLLWSTSLGLALGENASRYLCWYIAFHVGLSYFRAGWVKVKNLDWRNGKAPRAFIASAMYERTRLSDIALRLPLAPFAWSVMKFELTFALALIHPTVTVVYLTVGLAFHLGNGYLFGLNRFVFAWVAAYPVIYYCSFA